MSDTLDAAQPDGGPASSDPGYAASPGYILDGSSRYAPPPSARPAPPSPEHAGPTMWTVDYNYAPNTQTTFMWKGVSVAYHRDGIKTQPATDMQCGLRVHTQADADALARSTTNYANVDVAPNTARDDGSPVWIQWTHITGSLSVEGKVMLSAVTVNGDVTVSGDGSFLGLSNYASHFAHNLTVQNSSGIYTGGPGTTSFGNWTQYNGASQVDGNFAFIHNGFRFWFKRPLHQSY